METTTEHFNSIEVGDKVQWLENTYEVTEVGDDVSGVDGQHIEVELIDIGGNTTLEVGDTHVVHERLVNMWIEEERAFYIVE